MTTSTNSSTILSAAPSLSAVVFFNEIGDDNPGEVDLRKRGFAEITYPSSLGSGIEDYSVYFYSQEGSVISSEGIHVRDDMGRTEKGHFLNFVRYNDANASIHAYAIVKGSIELIQFVSLEVAIRGTEGPADGIESNIFGSTPKPLLRIKNRNLRQGDSPPNQSSFGLVGEGCDPDSFTPVEIRPTPGETNPGQTFDNCASYSEQPSISPIMSSSLNQSFSQFPSQFPSQSPSISPSQSLSYTTSTFSAQRGGEDLNTGSSIGIAAAVLVILGALFVGKKYYFSRRKESDEARYFEGDEKTIERGIEDIEAPALEALFTTPESVLKNRIPTPEPTSPPSILKQSTHTVRKKNVLDDESRSTCSSSVRVRSLMSSPTLEAPFTTLESVPKNRIPTPEPTLPPSILKQSTHTVRKENVLDDESRSTCSSSVRVRSLMSSNLLPQSTTPLPQNPTTQPPLVSTIPSAEVMDAKIKPLHKPTEWKIVSDDQPLRQSDTSKNSTSNSTANSTSSMRSRTLMSKNF